MRLQVSTEDMPESDRFDAWNATIFSSLVISTEPLPGVSGPFRARFSARTSGPLLNRGFDPEGFHAIRREREIARRRWDGYWVYLERSAGAWFHVGGQLPDLG
jgi:hypothetical protein